MGDLTGIPSIEMGLSFVFFFVSFMQMRQRIKSNACFIDVNTLFFSFIGL